MKLPETVMAWLWEPSPIIESENRCFLEEGAPMNGDGDTENY